MVFFRNWFGTKCQFFGTDSELSARFSELTIGWTANENGPIDPKRHSRMTFKSIDGAVIYRKFSSGLEPFYHIHRCPHSLHRYKTSTPVCPTNLFAVELDLPQCGQGGLERSVAHPPVTAASCSSVSSMPSFSASARISS